MKIGIDGNLLCGKKTGMGVVLYNIITRLHFPNDCQVFLYIPEQLDTKIEIELRKTKINIKQLPKKNYMIWEQIILPVQAKKDNIDVFWFPFNTGSLYMKCRKIVTIHDLIFMHGGVLSPQTLYKKMGKIYRRLIVPYMVKTSDRIITISETAKDEIIKFFPKYESKIQISYNGCDYSEEYLSELEWERFKQSNQLNKKFILAFGSLEERKNTMRIIRAFEKFSKECCECDLVLFGFRGWEESAENAYIRERNIKGIHILGYISEGEKNTLYQKAECFLFPSLSEGFGLPILEAFYNKTVVITSSISSMPEIAGDAAIYVDPFNEEDILKALENVMSNIIGRTNIIARGQERLNAFSWQNAGEIIQKELLSFNYE